MRGLWLEERQLRLREDLPLPVPAPGEALVRVRLAGICATDLELLQGYYPFTGIPGHEFVGEIAALGPAPAPDAFAPGHPGSPGAPGFSVASGSSVFPGSSGSAEPGSPSSGAFGPVDAWLRGTQPALAPAWPLGQRVVGEINLPCGHCTQCRAGRGNHCLSRRVLGIKGKDGAFAEYLVLPLANLHPVPAAVSDEAAVFCEPLAAALRIQEQRPIAPGERVLVVGAGRLGQLIALSLAADHQPPGGEQDERSPPSTHLPGGFTLGVVARHPRQRALLAAQGIPWLSEDQLVPGDWDVVIEASGTPAGFDLARAALRAAGTLILKSTYATQAKIDLSRLVVDEISLLGSRCGPFAPALAALGHGLDPRPLIEGRFPLTQGQSAFAAAARPGALKMLLDCRDRICGPLAGPC